jgi:hypothetical protein
MSPLDSFNNYNEEIPVKDNTGISESKDYKSPVNELENIKLRERIYETISEVLSDEETEEIIDIVISKF